MDLKNLVDKDRSKYLPSISLDKYSIPSKGIGYPEGFTIKYYPYTFGEIKQISQSKLSIEDKYRFVLSGIETSFDKYDLTTSDFIYIGILRNLSTFDTREIKVNYYCRHCFKHQMDIISLKDVEFDDLKSDLKVPYEVEFSFGRLEFRPLTLKMLIELFVNGLYEDNIAVATMQSLKNKDVKEAENEFIETYNKFVYSTLEDIQKLNKVAKDFYHGISKKEFKCKECQQTNLVSVDGGDGDVFITPFREHLELNTD